jgi:hypothetical protein
MMEKKKIKIKIKKRIYFLKIFLFILSMWKRTLGYYDGMAGEFLNPDRKLKDFLWKMGTLLTTIRQSMSGQQSKPCRLWQDIHHHYIVYIHHHQLPFFKVAQTSIYVVHMESI